MENNKYYDEIMKLDESDDIKRIIKKWSNFSENKKVYTSGHSVVLPDMLWIVKSGYGKTKLLKLLSGYLYDEKLMDFYGDVRYFEYTLDYYPELSYSKLSDDFKDVLLNAAGFRAEFKGVMCIDISQWLDRLNDKRFIRFLNYLSENTAIWHIIFCINSNNKEKNEKAEALLSVYFRIEKVVFKLPETSRLIEYMEKKFEAHGFKVESGAKEILSGTIDELRKGKYFDGYKTLKMLCSDLIYRAFSADDFQGYVITEKTVEYYRKDSDFINRTKINIEKRNTIGFSS